jgi:hypothetical protein
MSSLNKNDVFNEVSRRTDTKGTAISVAETKRVIKAYHDYLLEMSWEDRVRYVIKVLFK